MSDRPEWQQRVLKEQEELQKKLDKLCAFVANDNFMSLSDVDRVLLTQQQSAMYHYNNILLQRIERFNQKD